jgi:flagellar hook-associated protein 3 FlgL
MRISTQTIYENGVSSLGNLQTGLARTQNQLSTGRRILTAADDPIASARALEVTQSEQINLQLATNRQNANSSLSQVELALTNVTGLLQDVKTLAVNAGNATFTDADRNSLATELSGRLDDLLGLANTADGAGGYLFSGFKANTLPFIKTPTGAQYQGDQGQRFLQVGSTRELPISDSGNSVFEDNITGNGTFATSATKVPPNTGSGIVSSGSVTNAALLTGQNYSISFTVVPPAVPGGLPVTTFDVTNTTTGTPVSVGNAYVSAQPINFDGLQLDVRGSPANGDSFTIVPSTKQSIFTTLTDLIGALRSANSGATGQANLTNALNVAHDNINSSLDNVLSVRSTVGSRLREVDALDNAGQDLNIQYKQTLSDLQDLDYTQALSKFAQTQTTLEAAQRSFIKITGLSLFNFLG